MIGNLAILLCLQALYLTAFNFIYGAGQLCNGARLIGRGGL